MVYKYSTAISVLTLAASDYNLEEQPGRPGNKLNAAENLIAEDIQILQTIYWYRVQIYSFTIDVYCLQQLHQVIEVH